MYVGSCLPNRWNVHFTGLSTSVLQHASRIQELTGLLEDRNEQVSQLEDALVDLQMQLETVQSESESRENENDAVAAALHAHAASLEQELASSQARLAASEKTLADTARRLASAEDDRDLFRKLYDEASAHAQRLARENGELEERVTRAETQRDEGVKGVRAVFEARVRAAQEVAARWKGAHDVLVERNARTDDEVRRRAALEPELQEEVRRLRGELAFAREEMLRMTRVGVSAPVALQVMSAEDDDGDDGEYVPNECGSSGSSSSSDSSSESVSPADEPDHPDSDGEDTKDVYLCQFTSEGVMCNEGFPTAQVSHSVPFTDVLAC